MSWQDYSSLFHLCYKVYEMKTVRIWGLLVFLQETQINSSLFLAMLEAQLCVLSLWNIYTTGCISRTVLNRYSWSPDFNAHWY